MVSVNQTAREGTQAPLGQTAHAPVRTGGAMSRVSADHCILAQEVKGKDVRPTKRNVAEDEEKLCKVLEDVRMYWADVE